MNIKEKLLAAEPGTIHPSRGRMNPVVKAPLLEALRSGQYQQGDSYLHYRDTFCCLGVSCELGIKAGIIPESAPADSDGYVYRYAGEAHGLPDKMQDWANLDSLGEFTSDAPLFIDEDETHEEGDGFHEVTLADLNDTYGFNFAEIADFIEKHF